jgi:predicted nucleic acid-binding protein
MSSSLEAVMYLDGSALCRFLPGVRFFEEFTAWALPNLQLLATSQLGLTELRQAAALYPRDEKDRAYVVVEEVRARIPVVRFSDDNVQVSTHAASVLRPFAALHLGAAVAHPSIDTIVTYDAELARAAQLYELAVLSPGLPAGWQNGAVG